MFIGKTRFYSKPGIMQTPAFYPCRPAEARKSTHHGLLPFALRRPPPNPVPFSRTFFALLLIFLLLLPHQNLSYICIFEVIV